VSIGFKNIKEMDYLMKKIKKSVSLLLVVIFVMSLSTPVYSNEVKSIEQIPLSEYSSKIKSAEQSVLDFFEAIKKKDYDTLNRVSMNKLMSEDVLRNTIDMQHKIGMIAEEPPTILSSEMYGEDMVMVKVSYILAGEERIMIYPVMLVNNKWIVNVGDAVNPMDGDVICLEDSVHVIGNSHDRSRREILGYLKYWFALLFSLLYSGLNP
jgi:hypothetical protein